MMRTFVSGGMRVTIGGFRAGSAAWGRRRLRVASLVAFAFALLAAPLAAFGQDGAAAKVPRFVSLRSDEVNLRVGPGENYPIEWVLTRRGMPVEILKEFQNWRMVRDWQDTQGWVLDRMLTDKRSVMIDGAVRALYRRPDPASAIIARAEPGVVAKIVECRPEWCRVQAGGIKGWLRRDAVWGLLANETIQ